MSWDIRRPSSSTIQSLWINASGVIAHPDSPVGGGGPGRFSFFGPLGADRSGGDRTPHPQSPCLRHQPSILDGHLALLADRRKQSTTPESSSTAQVKIVTLNLYGSFPNPWNGKPNVEKLRAEPPMPPEGGEKPPSLWHPSRDDFIEILGSGAAPIEVDSFSQFLGIIQSQKVGSIARINLFSHGNDGLIGFSGTISEDTRSGKLDVRVGIYIAPKGLDENLITSLDPVPGKDGQLVDSLGTTARKLRDRFAKGAEICFFLCNSASLKTPLLQAVADAFQVTARGFPDEVMAGIQFNRTPNSRIERGFTYFKSKGWESRQRGFKYLESAMVSRTPRPDAGGN